MNGSDKNSSLEHAQIKINSFNRPYLPEYLVSGRVDKFPE